MKKLLIVGEGDFAYSLSLAKTFISDTNITVISFDTPAEARRNSNSGKANVEELERLGCTVIHGVNIQSMASDSRLDRYNSIVFDYSHAWLGFACESDFYYLRLHNEVFKGFMENARKMLIDKDAEIHVTHNTSVLYPSPEIEAKAEELGLRVIWKNEFSLYALGYFNKKGAGSTSKSRFPVPKVITFRAL